MSRITKPFCLDASELTYEHFYTISYALRSLGALNAGCWRYANEACVIICSDGRQLPRGTEPLPEMVSFATALHRIAEASTLTKAERAGFSAGDLAVSLIENPSLQVGDILRLIEDRGQKDPKWAVVDGDKDSVGSIINLSPSSVRKLTNIGVIR